VKQGHFVLVVEDDADIRLSIVEFLEESGYRALGAENGVEALHVLRTTEELPCLIFLDLMMPVMDGETFHRMLLEEPSWSSIPVILMSAYRDVAERAARLGAEHLAKPVGLDDLLRATRRHCDGSPSP
jgi:CheY-like chemotaxis protein